MTTDTAMHDTVRPLLRTIAGTVALALLATVLALVAPAPAVAADTLKRPPVPRHSGTGKRIVYDKSRQRVWLVRADKSVRATYLVSGHKYGSLPAVGRYRVKSKSRHSRSLDGAVSFEFMVRFVYGSTRWIGFHSIPVDDSGRRIQPLSKLGTPTSSGCIRQRWSKARELWRFSDVGTRVAVIP